MKSIIRRLTPVETCRLMGFNGDDYLDVDGAQTTDSPRYKACGNSWGVNSAEWVNFRIERVLRELGYVSNDRAVQYATTCSGVEAHSQAVKDCAWNANFFSEIEKFPCRVRGQIAGALAAEPGMKQQNYIMTPFTPPSPPVSRA